MKSFKHREFSYHCPDVTCGASEHKQHCVVYSVFLQLPTGDRFRVVRTRNSSYTVTTGKPLLNFHMVLCESVCYVLKNTCVFVSMHAPMEVRSQQQMSSFSLHLRI